MRYRIPEDVVSREVGGEAVLLNLATGTYFGLDGVGTEIWNLLAREGHLSQERYARSFPATLEPNQSHQDGSENNRHQQRPNGDDDE